MKIAKDVTKEVQEAHYPKKKIATELLMAKDHDWYSGEEVCKYQLVKRRSKLIICISIIKSTLIRTRADTNVLLIVYTGYVHFCIILFSVIFSL